jgi:uncharacterized protein YndB with AHSA1/START domain
MAHAIATKTEEHFRMDCSVRCDIAGPPDRIWALLTNATDYPRWNSTVTSLGPIGQKLELRCRSTKRTFRPK